jgi:hypothetical protein
MNTTLIEDVTDGLSGEILHSFERDDVVTVVEQRGATRHYHAVEFTEDGDGNKNAEGGYSTTEKHHYMGQRYQSRDRWGEYYAEVYWTPGESVRNPE